MAGYAVQCAGSGQPDGITRRKEGKLDGVKTNIVLGQIKITSVQSNAGIFYGASLLPGWRSCTKGNGGITRISGNRNLVLSKLNLIHDPDVIDFKVGGA